MVPKPDRGADDRLCGMAILLLLESDDGFNFRKVREEPVLGPREGGRAPSSDGLAGVFSRRYLGYSPPASLGQQHAGWCA